MFQRSSMNPDTNHLHQLIFYELKKKFKINIFFINLISAHLINLYNSIVFIVAIHNYQDSKFQISLIMLNLTVYTFIYFKLLKSRYKK